MIKTFNVQSSFSTSLNYYLYPKKSSKELILAIDRDVSKNGNPKFNLSTFCSFSADPLVVFCLAVLYD